MIHIELTYIPAKEIIKIEFLQYTLTENVATEQLDEQLIAIHRSDND